MRLYLELSLIESWTIVYGRSSHEFTIQLDVITIKYTRKNYAIRRISYLKRLKRIDEAKNGILAISTKSHGRGSWCCYIVAYGNCIIQSSNLTDRRYLFSKIALTSRRRSTYARITAQNTSTSRRAQAGSIQLVGAGRMRKHDESEHRGQPAV